jgi:hypothetical protein
MRSYKTSTGTYTEEELSVVVWLNPRKQGAKQAKSLETMTSESSSLPMAFPTRSLLSSRSWSDSVLAGSAADVYSSLPRSSRKNPIIVPLSVARSALGWDDFYIPAEYTEKI